MPRKPLTITRAYVRRYRDNESTVAYVEWSDGSRTEGRLDRHAAIRLHVELWHAHARAICEGEARRIKA